MHRSVPKPEKERNTWKISLLHSGMDPGGSCAQSKSGKVILPAAQAWKTKAPNRHESSFFRPSYGKKREGCPIHDRLISKRA